MQRVSMDSDRGDSKLPPGLKEPEELGCYGELGLVINPSNPAADRIELRQVLFDYLKYPSSDLARRHYESDRLGVIDVIHRNRNVQGQLSIIQEETLKVCTCCGFKQQPQAVPLLTHMDDITGLGSSTILLYEALKNCIYMMILATLVYGVYAVMTSAQLSGEACKDFKYCTTVGISQFPKRQGTSLLANQFYRVQAWLGVALVLVWGLWFVWMNYRERKVEIWTDRITVSASDFTILVESLPVNIDQYGLQKILDDYHRKIDPENKLEPFEIVRFNVAQPIHIKQEELEDEQLQSLKKWRGVKQEEFRRWLKMRVEHGQGIYFQVADFERQQKYAEFEKIKQSISDRVKVLSDKARQKFMEKKKNHFKNTVFVTFRYSSSQWTIVANNKSAFGRVRNCLICRGVKSSRLEIPGVEIHRAPEPEDVNFSNVGVPESTIILRKFITYFVAFALICATFVGIFFLKQTKYREKNSRATSITISVIITVVNINMGKIIKTLTHYERNYTRIHDQRSLAIKTILSQIASMVLLTFLQNVIIEKNFYGRGGLTEAIYFLALTNAFLNPILKFFDYRQIWSLIKRRYYNRPDNKLYSNQKQLNEEFEGKPFDVGDEYIYPVKTLVFTSFYLSLQPIIALFAAVGIFLMYWVDKYIMLRRCKRPPPGSDIVHHTLIQFVYLCPLFFCVGALVWPWFLKEFHADRVHPYVIGCIISIVLFLIPMEVIFDALITTDQDYMKYEDERIRFSAEYDRKNPATKEQAQLEYQQYLKELKRRVMNDQNKTASERNALLTLINEDTNSPDNPYWAQGFETNDEALDNIAFMAINSNEYQQQPYRQQPYQHPYQPTFPNQVPFSYQGGYSPSNQPYQQLPQFQP